MSLVIVVFVVFGAVVASALMSSWARWVPGALLLAGAVAMFGQMGDGRGDDHGLVGLGNFFLTLGGGGLIIAAMVAFALASARTKPTRTAESKPPEPAVPLAKATVVRGEHA